MHTEPLVLPEQANILLQRLLFQEKLTPQELNALYRAYAGLFPQRKPTLDTVEARLFADGAHTHVRAQLILNAWDAVYGQQLETAG